MEGGDQKDTKQPASKQQGKITHINLNKIVKAYNYKTAVSE